MFDFSALLKASFWFSQNPGPAGVYFSRSALIFGFLFLVALIAYLFVAKIKRRDLNPIWAKLWRKIYICFFTISILGGLLLFFRYEQISFLSMRFLTLLLWVGLVVWLVFIGIYYFRYFKPELDQYHEGLRREKYLGKNK